MMRIVLEQEEISHELFHTKSRVDFAIQPIDMLLRDRHSTTTNVKTHCGNTVLEGEIGLEILRLGARVTRRQNPNAIGNFMVGPLLKAENKLLRRRSPHSFREADSITKPLLIHEIDVILGGVELESSEHHVVRRGAELATIVSSDPDDHPVVRCTTDVLHAR